MKKICFAITCALCCAMMAQAADKADKKPDMKVATFNVRLETAADTGARAWQNRKSDVARLIKQYDFDVFGVQEIGSLSQRDDLKALIPGYTYYGKGRDNAAGTDGEQVGIFYKTNRFSIRDYGSFFLSPTPDRMSIGWDAALRRMCVWVKLHDTQTRKSFYVFCTHFDHMGVMARTESAKLLVSKIGEIAGDLPVLCLGDLNEPAEKSTMYEALAANLEDAREISKVVAKSSVGTFNGYDVSRNLFPASVRIDYIFCRKFAISRYAVLNDRYNNKTFPSDHFPVMVECRIDPARRTVL